MGSGRSIIDKIWQSHIVEESKNQAPAVLYIDQQLLHEVTSPQAFQLLRSKGLKVARPRQNIATVDHCAPSLPKGFDGSYPFVDEHARKQVETLEENCREFGIECFPLGHRYNGIVHVIGPELGLTLPGSTMVCGDSHASTHGAFGALSFGIGSTEVAHVLATQCLLQTKPKTFGVRVEGRLNPGVTAKDLVLEIIHRIGVAGGRGHVFEFFGSTIRRLSIEERMTICNMSIEAGARAGLVGPDDKTFEYLKGRHFAPKGQDFSDACHIWRELCSDQDVVYDKEIEIDASKIDARITYGTNPSMSIPFEGKVPEASGEDDISAALKYMKIKPGSSLHGTKVQQVFIGSCTNGRISDLRQVAQCLKGQKVAKGVKVLIVPGSQMVKRQAEDEGLDVIFRRAGAQWREPSCSMCNAINGDELLPGELAVSTSNRNFEGRQGVGGRTMLVSPLSAAAIALAGCVVNPRTHLPREVYQ